MNEVIPHWNQTYSNGNEINDDTILNALLFAHDQVRLSDSEVDLKKALYFAQHYKTVSNGYISTKI
jgi:glycogen synthase